MDDAQLLRYSRHILLEEIGIEGQQNILDARVLIIGAGGLGSPAGLYLGSAGVGRITLVDDDVVDVTNLQRQIAHNMAQVGHPKTESLKAAIAAINPGVNVTCIAARAEAALLDELVAQTDVVLDCSDNFNTRHAINAACVKHKKPLVSGAAIRFDAQISVYDLRESALQDGTGHLPTDKTPCYACVFPPDTEFEETRCATLGVLAPLVGIIGAMQAAEALKLLSGAGRSLAGRLLMLDGLSMEWNEIRVTRDVSCPVCGAGSAPSTH